MIRETAASVSYLPAGLGASLRKKFVLFSEAARAARDFYDNTLIGSLLDQSARKRPHPWKQRRNISFAARVCLLPFSCERRSFGVRGFTGWLFSDDCEMNGAPGFRARTAVHANIEFLLHRPDDRIQSCLCRRFLPKDGHMNGTPSPRAGLAINSDTEFLLHCTNGCI